MKKNTTAKKSQKALSKNDKKQLWKLASTKGLTIGIDLGDRQSRYCILNADGEVIS